MNRNAPNRAFAHRHLLGIEGLSADEINYLLDLADTYIEFNRGPEKKLDMLQPYIGHR